MELSLKPYHANFFPLAGVLVKSGLPQVWVHEAQQMGIHLEDVTVYPIPGLVANSLWGCLLILGKENIPNNIGQHSYCQKASDNLLIPEYSVVYPRLSVEESQKLFKNHLHIFHPDFGLVELTEPVQWQRILSLPSIEELPVISPADRVFIPMEIKSFQVKETPPEEVIKLMEENAFPKKEEFKDRPINILEKAKLYSLKLFFKPKNGKVNYTDANEIEKTNWLDKLTDMFSFLKNNKWMDKLQSDYEDLEKRNQKELDKLLDMLKKNPSEALKYAVPLDFGGGRGPRQEGLFRLSRQWFDFSLFGSFFPNVGGGRGGITSLADNQFHQLHTQYSLTAQKLIQEREFQKAAFIYLKLLRNNLLAAQTLENGGLYKEAASVYLTYGKNKPKAAECYEKARMYTQAIDLFKELNEDEKVGDLYLHVNRKDLAHQHFQKVIDGYKTNNQYVKASLIYKNKIGDAGEAQTLLLDGWRTNKDAYNCLNNYFSNIKDESALEQSIDTIYEKDTNEGNIENFLLALKLEHEKYPELQHRTKEIAYEIVANRVAKNPSILYELKSFNKKDKNLVKDILRFKNNKNRAVNK